MIMNFFFIQKKDFIQSSSLKLLRQQLLVVIYLNFILFWGEQINDKSWVIRIWYKPMIMLIWIGGLFMGIGGLLSLVKKN